MDGPKKSAESASKSLTETREAGTDIVFQPKLAGVMEVIDLMGTVASRVREDKSGDMGGGGSTGQAATKSGVSARDEAIAAVPETVVMQKKLIEHLETEIQRVEKEARRLSRSRARGAAFSLSEVFKKLRRLTAMISSLLQASADLIKRFYVSVFIDNQSIVVTEGSAVEGK